MPFGIIGRTGPGMRHVARDWSTGRGTFGGEFGARHCNQWGLYGVRVRQRRDAALFPSYFGQTSFSFVSGGDNNFHLGFITQGVGGQSPLDPVGVWQTKSPKSWSSLHCYKYWVQKRSKFEDFIQFTSWFLTSMFHSEGVNDPFGVHASRPCLAPPWKIRMNTHTATVTQTGGKTVPSLATLLAHSIKTKV